MADDAYSRWLKSMTEPTLHLSSDLPPACPALPPGTSTMKSSTYYYSPPLLIADPTASLTLSSGFVSTIAVAAVGSVFAIFVIASLVYLVRRKLWQLKRRTERVG
jgi:hypothetical protein